MPYNIFPSYNDLFGTYADNTDRGLMMSEFNLAYLFFRCMGYQNGVVSGCEITNPSGLNLSMAPGVVVLDGRIIKIPSALTATANGTYDEYISLTGGTIAELQTPTLNHSAIGTYDVKHSLYLRLAKVEASGGSISAVTDQRDFLTQTWSGSYIGDESPGFRFIRVCPESAECIPSVVFVSAESKGFLATNTSIFSISSIESCGNRRTPNGLPPNSRLWFSAGVGKNTFRVFEGSATWNFTLQWTGPQSTTVTVRGARLGDTVLVRHTDNNTVKYGTLYGFVYSDDTVHVYCSPQYLHSGTSITGTVYVRVLRKSDLMEEESGTRPITYGRGGGPFGRVNFETSASTCDVTPLIRKNGFTVSIGTQHVNLNMLGVTYNWIAIV